MKLADYLSASNVITAGAYGVIRAALSPYRSRPMPERGRGEAVGDLLTVIYPIVHEAQLRSSTVAREFYDEERREMTGRTDRHDLYLSESTPETFGEWIVPTVLDFANRLDRIKPEDYEVYASARIDEMAAETVKAVDGGGRSTLVRAVESDPVALGFARVAGGNESCAFCLTLISRGPVYESAESAGEMNQYHRFCDCRVVPVFDRDGWQGRDEFKAAEAAYVRASKAAKDADVDVMTALRYQLDGKPIPKKDEK